MGLVAGEHSGDALGAALIEALRARVPDVRCFGVAGPKMVAAGCEAWAGAEELAVMGLTEVLTHLPRLLRLRAMLARRFIGARPDVFVGIDSPEFNLRLARRIKDAGIRSRAIRQPAGVGLAPGTRAQHRPLRAIWCCACCPSRPIFMPATACAPSSSATRSPTRFR